MFRLKSLEVDIYKGDKPNEMIPSTGTWKCFLQLEIGKVCFGPEDLSQQRFL